MFTVPDSDPDSHLFRQDETGVSSRLYRLLNGARVVFHKLDRKACQEVIERLYPKDSVYACNLARSIRFLDENPESFGSEINGLKLALKSSDTDVIRHIRTSIAVDLTDALCRARAVKRFPETQLEKLEQASKAVAKKNSIPEKGPQNQWSICSDARDTDSFVPILPGGNDKAQALKGRQSSARTLRHRALTVKLQTETT